MLLVEQVSSSNVCCASERESRRRFAWALCSCETVSASSCRCLLGGGVAASCRDAAEAAREDTMAAPPRRSSEKAEKLCGQAGALSSLLQLVSVALLVAPADNQSDWRVPIVRPILRRLSLSLSLEQQGGRRNAEFPRDLLPLCVSGSAPCEQRRQ